MTQIRDAVPGDHDWLLALNQANLPAVGELSAGSLQALLPMQHRVRVAIDGERLLGAVFLMRPGKTYASTNYRWFCEHRGDFLYVDRVMVEADARGLGVGRLLYEDALALTLACRAPVLCCEVNTVPPNPSSMAFHESMGFRAILERDSSGGKRVMMLERPVDLPG